MCQNLIYIYSLIWETYIQHAYQEVEVMVLGLLSRPLLGLRSWTSTFEDGLYCGVREARFILEQTTYLGQLCSKFTDSGRGLTCGKAPVSCQVAGLGNIRSVLWPEVYRGPDSFDFFWLSEPDSFQFTATQIVMEHLLCSSHIVGAEHTELK